MARKPVAGVQFDFANNNVVVSIVNNGSIKVVTDQKGCCKVPLYVAFTDSDVLIGEKAKAYKYQRPGNCIYGMYL